MRISDCSSDVCSPDLVGLLGHNGAGKTTIMKMIAGYLEPTAGRVLVDGIEVERDRAVAQARLGYLPENCPLYPEMTVLEHLDFAAELRALHGAARLAAVRRDRKSTRLNSSH